MNTEDRDDAFVSLLTGHQSALRLYVASLLPGESSAADVAQQANTTIWRKRADFEMGTNFKAWAFSIARFEVLNFRKQAARDARLVFSDELDELIATEFEEVMDDFDDRQEALRLCLDKLKPQDRDLVRHRYRDGAPLAEYAAKSGRSPGGLKVTLHRLRKTLRQCVDRNIEEGKRAGA